MLLVMLLMMLLLIVLDRWQLAHSRSLRAQHLILLLELLDLSLELSNLDVLQLQLTMDLVHGLLLSAVIKVHLVLLLRALG